MTSTVPVQSTSIVVVGSSSNPGALPDSRRPLKRRLDLPLEVSTPTNTLDGASCAMQSSTVAPALDTTPQSKGLNKRGKPIIAYVGPSDVFIDLGSDDDDDDPTQEFYVVDEPVTDPGKSVKKETVAVIFTPSVDPLENAAGVAPPPDAPPVKSELHYAEHQKLKAEKAKKEAEDLLMLQKSERVMRFLAAQSIDLPEEIAAIVAESTQPKPLIAAAPTLEGPTDYPRPVDNAVPLTSPAPLSDVDVAPVTSVTIVEDYPRSGDMPLSSESAAPSLPVAGNDAAELNHPVQNDNGESAGTVEANPAGPPQVSEDAPCNRPDYPRTGDNTFSSTLLRPATVADPRLPESTLSLVGLPEIASSLPTDTDLALSQYDQLANYPRPGDNPVASSNEDAGKGEQPLNDAFREEDTGAVAAAAAVEQECMSSPDRGLAEENDEQLLDYSASPTEPSQQEREQSQHMQQQDTVSLPHP